MDNRIPKRFGRLLSMALAVATGLTPLASLSLGTAEASAATFAQVSAKPAADSAAMPTSPAQGTVESYILARMNADRVALGLAPLRVDPRLRDIARQRTSTMATLNDLSHTVAGNLGDELTAAGVTWLGWGEDIGWTTYPWGNAAGDSLYTMWKASPDHWTLMTSATYNYVGIGIGYRPANGGTFSSIVFTEQKDHTAPTVAMTSLARSGTTISFSWSGADVALQTRTAGLGYFDVEYHRDDRGWQMLRHGTLGTHLRLTGRAHGHRFYVRVRAVDKAGNASAWSPAVHILVP